MDEKLLQVLRDCVEICTSTKTPYAIYGSLAVFLYTKKASVADIDVLILEKDIHKLRPFFEEKGYSCTFDTKWHTMQCTKNGAILELDARDFWQKELSEETTTVSFQGMQLHAVPQNALLEIYQKAAIKNPEKYGATLTKLTST